MRAEVTPKNMVLDLLRVSPEPLAISGLVKAGGLFGFAEGTVRVTVTRLLASRRIQSGARGAYVLSPAADALSQHIEAWRLGDRRVRRWGGDWLATYLPRGLPRPAAGRTKKGLEILGFREGLRGLWIRPSNLRIPLLALRAKAVGLGVADSAELFAASDLDSRLTSRWRTRLWPLQTLARAQRGALRALEVSAKRLGRLFLEDAAREAYLVGGDAVRILAFDPLLPPEILASDTRRALTEAMLAYDRLGRSIWRGLLAADPRRTGR